jgi:hypothetical protein
MIAMPSVVTHRYDPAIGVSPGLCRLSDREALRVLEDLRHNGRPNLRPSYLVRRRATEEWLSAAANHLLGRLAEPCPAYFFLGDFRHAADPSRPAALLLPLRALPRDAITFTLGDSMGVAGQAGRRLYSLNEMAALFAQPEALAGFGFSDRYQVQDRFIEVQVWSRAWLSARASSSAREVRNRVTPVAP